MILIIDALPLCYQSFATVGHFCTSETKEPTGLRYGFLRSARSWSQKFKARKTVVCWDTPSPIFKAEGRTEYKSDRIQTPEKLTMFQQIPALKELLGLTYYTQLEAEGYEADDLCATVARFYENKFQEDSIIATVDRDSFSTVTDKISVFHTVKERAMIKPKDVLAHFGVSPNMVPAYKAVLGDASDHISPLLKGTQAEIFLEQLILANGGTSHDAIVNLLNGMHVDDDIITEALLNLRLTTLHEVPQDKWKITKGAKLADVLRLQFAKLEFKSLEKFIGELTEEPIWLAKGK